MQIIQYLTFRQHEALKILVMSGVKVKHVTNEMIYPGIPEAYINKHLFPSAMFRWPLSIIMLLYYQRRDQGSGQNRKERREEKEVDMRAVMKVS